MDSPENSDLAQQGGLDSPRMSASRTNSSCKTVSVPGCSTLRGKKKKNHILPVLHGNLKNHAPHIPVFVQHYAPMAVVLEPFPNSRITSWCVASSTIITCHSSGVNLYQEEPLIGEKNTDTGAPPLCSGVWRLKQTRDNYNLKEAYLCCPIQPLLDEHLLRTSAYSRYFCVAAGSDRTIHSVCVMSVTGGFCLHHEHHGRNRVVALYFSHVALESSQARHLTPFVVSVDEVGEVVVYNVDADVALKLERPRAMNSTNHTLFVDPHNISSATDAEATSDGLEEGAAMAKLLQGERDPYRVECGVATQVVLLGPCAELCNGCHNWSSQTESSGQRGASDNANVATSVRGASQAIAMSLFISTRARDVVLQPNSSAGVKKQSSDVEAEVEPDSAELLVLFVRFLWTSSGAAIVVSEVEQLREVAPTDVCDAGVALSVPPYRLAHSMRAFIARPRLRLWCVRGCTGEILRCCGVYADTEASGLGRRSIREYFLRWIPLGRHTLIQNLSTSWFCIAAVTDARKVLLLGQSPCSSEASCSHRSNTESRKDFFEQEKKQLDEWLSKVEEPSLAQDLPISCHAAASLGKMYPDVNCAQPSALPGGFEKRYTVLMELYSPHLQHKRLELGAPSLVGFLAHASFPSSRSTRVRHRRAHACTTSVQEVYVDFGNNTLLLMMSDNKSLLQLSLPFTDKLKRVSIHEDALLHVAENSLLPKAVPTSPIKETCTTDPAGDLVQSSAKALATTFLSSINTSSRKLPAQAEARPQISLLQRFALPSTLAHSLNASENYSLNIVRPIATALSYFMPDQNTAEESRATELSDHAIDSANQPHSAAKHFTAEVNPASCSSNLSPESSVTNQGAHVIDVPSRPASGPRDGVRYTNHNVTGNGSIVQHLPIKEFNSQFPRRIDAVYIDLRKVPSVDAPKRRLRHKQSLKSCALQERDTASPVDCEQREYMRQQLEQALPDEHDKRVLTDQEGINLLTFRAPTLMEVLGMEEEKERNRIYYSWTDLHNSLYIEFTLAKDSMVLQEEDHRRRVAARRDEERKVYERSVQRDAFGGALMGSTRFIQHYRESFLCQGGFINNSRLFNFDLYFKTCRAPQFLLDMQERDKCLFEIKDLQLKQERELEAINPFDTVVFYQNEERVLFLENDASAGARAGGCGRGTSSWKLHSTFPYDDETGRAIDLTVWNANASLDSAEGWVWASKYTSPEAGYKVSLTSASNSESTSVPSRVQALTRGLQDWQIGPWKYATRWPSAEEQLKSSFSWSTEEEAGSTVRRRPISRKRVNVRLMAERERLSKQHMQQLEKLREELNL